MVRIRRAIALAVGTGLGTGYSPFAPGTAGSALGVALFLLLAPGGWALNLGVLALVLALGTWAAQECGARFGEHDHRRIVVDEVAGQLITLLSFPARSLWPVAGFFIFRFYDIVKPFPARHVDRTWRSAVGVMADDVIAGVYANLTLQVIRAWWGPG